MLCRSEGNFTYNAGNFKRRGLVLACVGDNVTPSGSVVSRYTSRVTRFKGMASTGLISRLGPCKLMSSGKSMLFPVVGGQRSHFRRVARGLMGSVDTRLGGGYNSLTDRCNVSGRGITVIVLCRRIV